jgi:hypothetical protein
LDGEYDWESKERALVRERDAEGDSNLHEAQSNGSSRLSRQDKRTAS